MQNDGTFDFIEQTFQWVWLSFGLSVLPLIISIVTLILVVMIYIRLRKKG